MADETAVDYVVKFHLQDTDELGRLSIKNIWVAARAKPNDGFTAVADALKLLDRNGIDLRNVKYVGFEDTANLKGNQR